MSQQKSKLSGLNSYLMFDCLGGPRVCKTRYTVNFFKGSTWLFCLLLMVYYNNFSIVPLVYTYFYKINSALHGTYGILWLIKDFAFPDSNWEKQQTIASWIAGVLLLGPGYWGFPYLLISGQSGHITNFRIMLAIISYVMGVSIMLVSDAQKYYTLQYKKGLINSGMFKYTRNPNYLGEILVYGGFGLLVKHYWVYIVLTFAWGVMFNLNMYLKDHDSLQFKDGWEKYQKTSNRLLPRMFESTILDNGFYVLFILFLHYALRF